jgi:predicted short-subunit dehydrogenase-like oxidoreductase (DUF2520 family)
MHRRCGTGSQQEIIFLFAAPALINRTVIKTAYIVRMAKQQESKLRVVLIGSGNVATHLGMALRDAGAVITQVYSRKVEHARILAKKLKAKAIKNVTEIEKHPALVIIAVKDDAIPAIVKKLNVTEGIVVHTSGSISMDVLGKFPQYGVLYPLQSFSADKKTDLSQVPLCIEGSDSGTLFSLTNIAEAISDCVYNLDSKQRQVAHMAAVFANNFTNHLYYVSDMLLKKENLPFDLLQPLIAETADKIRQLSPKEAQTGPAIRDDQTVIRKHLQFLAGSPDVQRLYLDLSRSITKSAKRKS